MSHQYKRRTLNDAKTVALQAFHASAKEYLSEDELREMIEHGATAGGSFGDDWEADTGFVPDPRLFYEIKLYHPSKEFPYIEKYFARLLVSRDRATETVWIKWKPPTPPYSGEQLFPKDITIT
ncbi:DUF440 family protein [Lacipirellula sp.]|uniref:DUF440 family protein n=1 Tax=Lacipirellula sp. TaxID=2691419 RepID=UPI003D132C3B